MVSLFTAAAFSNELENYLDYVQQLDSTQFHDERIEGYESLYTAHHEISKTVKKYPGRVHPLLIGRTVDNHPIWVFRFQTP